MFETLSKEIYIKISYLKAIDWKNKENRRNYSKFKDILRSVTFFKIKQRECVNGYYLADIEDFDVALRIYKGTSKNNATNLTDTEIDILKFIAEAPRTIKDLQKHTGKSRVRVMQILCGKNGKSRMLAKVQGLNKVYREIKTLSDIDETGEITDEVTTKGNIYSYNGSVDFNVYDSVASLDREKAIDECVTTGTLLSPNCNPSKFTLKPSTVKRININCNLNNNNISNYSAY